MHIAQMPVSFGDEQTAIFVAKPCGDGFEIDSRFYCVAAKIVPEGMMREGREIAQFTGAANGRFRAIDGDDSISCGRSATMLPELLEEGLQIRKEGNRADLMILGACFASGHVK